MKKNFYLIIFFLHSSFCFSQQVFGELDVNDIRCNVSSTGDLFNRFGDDNLPGFNVPSTSQSRTIYAANLWIAGVDVQDQIKLAAELYQGNGQDFYCGPLTNDGTATTNDEIMQQFNQVWLANSFDVQQHQLYFDLVSAGLSTEEQFPNGYVIPSWFYTWPAHGDLALLQDLYLLPFNDFNSDGYYNPEAGDSPSFCGDKAVFFIINDAGGVHEESQGQPLGIQIIGSIYGYENYSTSISNTIFVSYAISKKSTSEIINCKAGLWSDFDLGNPMDDFIGTDVSRGCVFAYNGDELDEDVSGAVGYGTDLPIQGLVMLNGPQADLDITDNPLSQNLNEVISQNGIPYAALGDGYGDGVVDNENLGLGGSIVFNTSSSPVNGTPTSPYHFYNYLNQRWKNGTLLTSGEQGTSPNQPACLYMYPDSSDPLFYSSSGIEVTNWSEETALNTPGHRSVLVSTPSFTFHPGDTKYLDFAYVFARESDDSAPVLETFKNRVDEVRSFYNQNGTNCSIASSTLGSKQVDSGIEFNLFPNPTDGMVTVSLSNSDSKSTLIIYDMMGKETKRQVLTSKSNQIDLSGFSKGVYLVTVSTKYASRSTRIIIK